MSDPQSRQLEPAIESLLSQLRGRIRAYVWAEGIAVALVVLGFAFWGSLCFDWVFEPPVWLRVVVLSLVGLLLLSVVYRLILRRAFVRLGDRSLALVLERRFRHFGDSLLTSVEMAEIPSHAAEFNPEMLATTRAEALVATRDVELGRVFNARPLIRNLALALFFAVSVAAFSFMARESFGIWSRRTLLLSDELWPRKTHLHVEGFDKNRRAKIARGADFELSVKADASPGRVVPANVQVRHTTEQGASGRENMSREGQAIPGRDEFQQYRFTFKREMAARVLYVVGGDDREGPYYLDVVDSPTINQMTLRCEYPEYMHRTPRDIPVSGVVQLPRGTKATIEAQSNKDLVQVQIDDISDEKSPETHKIKVAQDDKRPLRTFSFPLPPLDSDKTLIFTLFDSDGIRSRDPVRLSLAAAADEAPQVDVELKGIGTAITSGARLPVEGEVSDDYGLAKLWFDYRIDEGEAKQQPLATRIDGQDKLEVSEALEVGPLKLVPKQKLHLNVKAVDSYALEDTPNSGAGPQYVLDVVTPDQLRAILAARELALRRRLETIMQEMTDTRDSLARISFEPIPASPKQPEGKIPAVKPPATSPSTSFLAPTAKPISGAEPGDEPGDKTSKQSDVSPEQRLAQRLVLAERTVQNSERSANETLNLAVAFDEIQAELINNRVDTEELRSRLKDGIADPLRSIATELFPVLEARLKAMQAGINDPAAAEKAQAAALAQSDAILVRMKQVLDKMLELETFNEVLDRLRTIIALQEKMNLETKEKQKQKLRNLLED